MGAADFKLFQGSPLMEAAENQSVKPLLVVCLARGSLMVVGTRLMGAHLGGWSEDSQGCVTALATNHPELVFLAFGAPDVAPDPSHPDEVHGVLLDMYEWPRHHGKGEVHGKHDVQLARSGAIHRATLSRDSSRERGQLPENQSAGAGVRNDCRCALGRRRRTSRRTA